MKAMLKRDHPALPVSRRHVNKMLLYTGGAIALPVLAAATSPENASAPSYLRGYEDLYAASPGEAALSWFRDAKYGLFLHYGLYSLLGGEWCGRQATDGTVRIAEWIQYLAKIPVAEYAALKEQFTASKFDADRITDVALAAGMKYVNITTRHHDGFCLFESRESDFSSVNSPARRDLIAELSEQCARKGLGLFLYYSHGRDWRHPHAPTRDWHPTARPDYAERQPEYLYGGEDIGIYVEFMERQITELLTQYGPIAGIWFDGEGVLKAYAEKVGGLEKVVTTMRLHELYKRIHELQPACLVSYKRGVTGAEDLLAPERKSFGLEKFSKPVEICYTMQDYSWGYDKYSTRRMSAEEVLETLRMAGSYGANLLLNSGPLGSGALVPEEEASLLKAGKRIAL
jgi:alpha-L-fucosidase